MLKNIPRPVISIVSFIIFTLFYVLILAVDSTSGGIQSFYIFAASPLLMLIYCALCGYFLYRKNEKTYTVSLFILSGYAVFLIGAAVFNAVSYDDYNDGVYFLFIHLFYIMEIVCITSFCSKLAKRIGEEREAKKKAGFGTSEKNNKKTKG